MKKTEHIQEKICQQCGNTISAQATICPVCGAGKKQLKGKWEQKFADMKQIKNPQKKRSRFHVIILSLFLCGIGNIFAYRYLGYTDKAAERAGLYLSVLFNLFLSGFFLQPWLIFWGFIQMFKYMFLSLYDIFYFTFIVKYDAYGNKV